MGYIKILFLIAAISLLTNYTHLKFKEIRPPVYVVAMNPVKHNGMNVYLKGTVVSRHRESSLFNVDIEGFEIRVESKVELKLDEVVMIYGKVVVGDNIWFIDADNVKVVDYISIKTYVSYALIVVVLFFLLRQFVSNYKLIKWQIS